MTAAVRDLNITRPGTVVLVGLSMAGIAGLALAALQLSPELLMVLAMAAIAIVPLVVKAYNGTFDPFEPLSISSAAILLFFVVRPLFDMASGDFLWAATDVSQWIPTAMWATLLAVASFTAGYLIVRPVTRFFPEPPAEVTDSGLLFWGTILTGVAIAGLVAAATLNGGLATLLANRADTDRSLTVNIPFFSVATLVSIPVLFLLGRVRGGGRTLARPMMLIALVILLIGAIPKGDRRELLPLMAAIIGYWYLVRDRRPSLLAMSIVVIASFFLIVSPLRITRVSSEDYVSAVVDGVKDAPGAITQFFVVQDTAMLNSVALGIGNIGDNQLVPLQGGTSMLSETVLLPVPRAIWAAKPEPIRTLLIERLYGYGAGRCVSLCPTFTGVVSMYADFGLPGVVIGGFVIGALFRAWYGWYQRWRDRFIAQAAFATMILTPVWLWWNDVGRTISDFFTLAAPVIIVGILAARRDRVVEQREAPQPAAASP